MHRLLRLFHTLRPLRLRQLFYQAFYRLSGRLQSSQVFARRAVPVGNTTQEERPKSRLALRPDHAEPVLYPSGAIAPKTWTGSASFNFLNISHDFKEPAGIDWNFSPHGKLWTYNLNYFEFLRQRTVNVSEAQALMDDWIDKSARRLIVDGWEPYPLSLRIVHWIRFYQERNLPMPRHVADSLYQQYRNLQRKIEYHLMGNHLLENAIALTVAAAFFSDRKYQPQASKLLVSQLEEQYLPQGAHFERSTMYHCILGWRLLDLYAQSTGKVPDGMALFKQPGYFEVLQNSLQRQFNWLHYWLAENHEYPHFNDSIPGIAPPANQLLAYAHSLNPDLVTPPLLSPTPKDVRHYHFPENAPFIDLWIDASSVGPSYIPGHAHADDLTFCVSVQGQPVIVDPGISTYEKNARRAWERSTVAHNTVTVNNQNSSDVWGGFRVGKRARTSVEITSDQQQFIAHHDGYPGGHRRTFALWESSLEITDELAATGVTRLHFDHACTLLMQENELTVNGLRVSWSPTTTARLVDYQQALGFNRLVPAKVLELEFTGKLVVSITPNSLPSPS